MSTLKLQSTDPHYLYMHGILASKCTASVIRAYYYPLHPFLNVKTLLHDGHVHLLFFIRMQIVVSGVATYKKRLNYKYIV